MLFSENLFETQTHELLMTFLVAMVPVIELRGAIPAGIAAGLAPALFVAPRDVPSGAHVVLEAGRCRR